MTREQLCTRVAGSFGPRLERGSLEEIEQFLAELEAELPGPASAEILSLDGTPASYEAAMREFFGRSLEVGDEQALCQLWVTAVRMWVAAMQQQAC
jgi:hypothetical protein